MTKSFYIYVHYHSETVPFYVGKGTRKRALDIDTKNRRRNKSYAAIVEKYGVDNIKVIFIQEFENEKLAYQKEREEIQRLRELGFSLVNKNAGGHGGIVPSEETRLKMRNAKLGTKRSLEACLKTSQTLSGKPKTAEHVAAMSKALKGRRPTEAVIAASVARHLGSKHSDMTKRLMSFRHTRRNVANKIIRAMLRNTFPDIVI
jgi:hypothetical protein